jgi:hypothetical protein
MDNNVTIGHLKNLVIDKPAPITVKLAQTSGNDFALMDNNVTIGHLKNLVIDKPAPITVKLAQTSGNDFALMDNNVTTAHLKNLVIDKPAPITTKLAQVQGNDFALMDNNVTIGHLKNLVIDKPAPITVKLAQIEKADKFNFGQKDATNVQLDAQNPVWNPPFNNWSVNQPSVPHDSGDRGDQDLELRDIIIDGVNGYDLVQTHAKNPVWNPPFNNWSVNQPSVPH